MTTIGVALAYIVTGLGAGVIVFLLGWRFGADHQARHMKKRPAPSTTIGTAAEIQMTSLKVRRR